MGLKTLHFVVEKHAKLMKSSGRNTVCDGTQSEVGNLFFFGAAAVQGGTRQTFVQVCSQREANIRKLLPRCNAGYILMNTLARLE